MKKALVPFGIVLAVLLVGFGLGYLLFKIVY